MEYTVNHYPEKHRFEVVEDGLTASDIEITAREILKVKKELYTIISDQFHGQPYIWC